MGSVQQPGLDGGSYFLTFFTYACVLNLPLQLSDFDYAGKALIAICKEIRETIIEEKLQ